MFSQIEKKGGETWCQYKGLNQIPQKQQTEEAKNLNGKDQDIERKESGIKKNVKEPNGIHPHPLKIASHHPPPPLFSKSCGRHWFWTTSGYNSPLAMTRHWQWLTSGRPPRGESPAWPWWCSSPGPAHTAPGWTLPPEGRQFSENTKSSWVIKLDLNSHPILISWVLELL